MPAPASPLRPRKKPLQPRAVATVSYLLEAAAQILEAEGFERFNTNAVAERAGVSIGSLYQYFPSKHALLIALMLREKERFHDDASAALAAPSGREALGHLIGAAVRQQMTRPELARLLDIEELRPEAQRETADASGIRHIVRTILDRPDLPRQSDPELATDELVMIVQTLVDAAGARLDADGAALEQRVRATVFGYLSAAIGAPPSARM